MFQKRLNDTFVSAITMYLIPLLCNEWHQQDISLQCQQLNSDEINKNQG